MNVTPRFIRTTLFRFYPSGESWSFKDFQTNHLKCKLNGKTYPTILTLIKRSVTSVNARNRKEFRKIWELAVRGRQKCRLHRCWWRMLATKCVGDKFEMLVTDIDKITNITKKVTIIMIMPPTSQISQYHKVTKIMSTTSLSPKMYHRSWDVRTVRWSLPWLRVLNKFSPYMAHKIYEFVVQYFKILNGFWINFPIVWKILPNFGKRIQTLPLQTDENHSNGHYSS